LPSHPASISFPYTTLFRSHVLISERARRRYHRGKLLDRVDGAATRKAHGKHAHGGSCRPLPPVHHALEQKSILPCSWLRKGQYKDRKSTRLNSSHVKISYA